MRIGRSGVQVLSFSLWGVLADMEVCRCERVVMNVQSLLAMYTLLGGHASVRQTQARKAASSSVADSS